MEKEYLLNKIIELLKQAGVEYPNLIKQNSVYYTVEGTNLIIASTCGNNFTVDYNGGSFRVQFYKKFQKGDYVQLGLKRNIVIDHRRLNFPNITIISNLIKEQPKFIDYGSDANIYHQLNNVYRSTSHSPISVSTLKHRIDEWNKDYLTLYGQVARELKNRIIFY